MEENNAKEDYDIKRGFKDLAKNITHVYGNMIQSNLVDEFQDYQIPEPIFDENPEYFSFPYQKDSIGNEAKILDGLNKVSKIKRNFYNA